MLIVIKLQSQIRDRKLDLAAFSPAGSSSPDRPGLDFNAAVRAERGKKKAGASQFLSAARQTAWQDPYPPYIGRGESGVFKNYDGTI
jgi:hypothetical protein